MGYDGSYGGEILLSPFHHHNHLRNDSNLNNHCRRNNNSSSASQSIETAVKIRSDMTSFQLEDNIIPCCNSGGKREFTGSVIERPTDDKDR